MTAGSLLVWRRSSHMSYVIVLLFQSGSLTDVVGRIFLPRPLVVIKYTFLFPLARYVNNYSD